MFDALIGNIEREILTLKTNHRKSLVNIKLTKKTFRLRLGGGFWTRIYVYPDKDALTTLNLSQYTTTDIYHGILHVHWFTKQVRMQDNRVIYWVAHGDTGNQEVDATITCTSNFECEVVYDE